MEEKIVRIIAIHPVNGVMVKTLKFNNEDEEFLEDEDGFDSFEEYVDYYIIDELDSFEQSGYVAISVNEHEVLDIISELSK